MSVPNPVNEPTNTDAVERAAVGVQLRRVADADLAWLAETASDPHLIGAHNWAGEPRSAADVEVDLRKRFRADGFTGTDVGTLVVTLDDGTRIGEVDWRTERWGPSFRSRCRAFGIALRPEYRGHGYGTTAQRLLIGYLFAADIDLNRVQSDTAADNPAEKRSLEKAGMVAEGVVRQAEYRGGRYHDHVLFGILRSEWDARTSDLD